MLPINFMGKISIVFIAVLTFATVSHSEMIDDVGEISLDAHEVPAPVNLDELPSVNETSTETAATSKSTDKKSDLTQAKEATKVLNRKIQIVDSSLDEETQEIQLHKQEVAAELKRVVRLQKELADKNKKLGRLKSQKKGLVAQKEKLRKQKKQLNSEIRSLAAADKPKKHKSKKF